MMKYIREYNSYEEDIPYICKQWGIKKKAYAINTDGSIDVNDSVDLHNSITLVSDDHIIQLDKLPIKFRNIIWNFRCDQNNLTSLEGCPQYVRGYFNCRDNN